MHKSCLICVQSVCIFVKHILQQAWQYPNIHLPLQGETSLHDEAGQESGDHQEEGGVGERGGVTPVVRAIEVVQGIL